MKPEDELLLGGTILLSNQLISDSKSLYYKKLGNKLNNPNTAPKTYWSILNRFLGNSKVPSIPPLLVNNKFITDFVLKANIFNDYFALQCTVNETNSILPLNISSLGTSVSNVRFSNDDILRYSKL